MKMWTERHALAFSSIIEALNKSELQWMVLRNYEGLPNDNRSKDIDLLVDKRDFTYARYTILSTLENFGFLKFYEEKFQYAWCFTFFNENSSEPYSIKIDLLDGFVWKGAQIVEFSELYARRVAYKNFFVPDIANDGFMLWIKPLMTGGIVKEKYRADILRAYEAAPFQFFALLQQTFGRALAEKLNPFVQKGDLVGTAQYKHDMCRSAWRRKFYRKPVATIFAMAEHFYLEITRRSNRPKGTVIAVVGPDGAGKSTFIELLRKSLPQLFVKDLDRVRVQHFRPNVMPNLKKLFSGKNYDETKEEFTSPHRAKPAHAISSLIRLTYYWADYVLGYWLQIRKSAISGHIHIFDRYFYDFIVDPSRSRIKLPKWIPSLFLKFTPEPDVVFFLDCDAATIYSRKQELSQNEIERQLHDYRLLAKNSARFVVLDGHQIPQKICSDSMFGLLKKIFPKTSSTNINVS